MNYDLKINLTYTQNNFHKAQMPENPLFLKEEKTFNKKNNIK